jgi:hypothetical protein
MRAWIVSPILGAALIALAISSAEAREMRATGSPYHGMSAQEARFPLTEALLDSGDRHPLALSTTSTVSMILEAPRRQARDLVALISSNRSPRRQSRQPSCHPATR